MNRRVGLLLVIIMLVIIVIVVAPVVMNTIADDVENYDISSDDENNVVYYNPVDAKLCTKSEWINNTNKNGKLGCMRWYVYGEEDNKRKLILDHNTSDEVAWLSADDYVKDDNCRYEVCNNQTATTLMKQLAEDTAKWKIKADIITLEEVANLIPYYQNLTESEKNLFLSPTRENSSVFETYYVKLENARRSMCYQNQTLCKQSVEAMKAQIEYMEKNYSELIIPKYIYQDMMKICENGNNNKNNQIEGCDAYGFWTKTADTSSSIYVWYVSSNGSLRGKACYVSKNGLRPVIKVSK